MRLLMIGLGVLSLLAGGGVAISAETDEEPTPIRRVADLPEPVRALLGGPMADPGGRYTVADAGLPGDPFLRMIWAARLKDGRYVVHYEQGGRARGARTAVIAPSGWEHYETVGRGFPGMRFSSVQAFLSADAAFAAIP